MEKQRRRGQTPPRQASGQNTPERVQPPRPPEPMDEMRRRVRRQRGRPRGPRQRQPEDHERGAGAVDEAELDNEHERGAGAVDQAELDNEHERGDGTVDRAEFLPGGVSQGCPPELDPSAPSVGALADLQDVDDAHEDEHEDDESVFFPKGGEREADDQVEEEDELYGSASRPRPSPETAAPRGDEADWERLQGNLGVPRTAAGQQAAGAVRRLLSDAQPRLQATVQVVVHLDATAVNARVTAALVEPLLRPEIDQLKAVLLARLDPLTTDVAQLRQDVDRATALLATLPAPVPQQPTAPTATDQVLTVLLDQVRTQAVLLDEVRAAASKLTSLAVTDDAATTGGVDAGTLGSAAAITAIEQAQETLLRRLGDLVWLTLTFASTAGVALATDLLTALQWAVGLLSLWFQVHPPSGS